MSHHFGKNPLCCKFIVIFQNFVLPNWHTSMHFLDFFGKSTVRFFSPPESQAQTGTVECWEELRRQLRIQWSNVVWVRIYGRFMVYLWMFHAYGFSWYLWIFDVCGFWQYIYGFFFVFFNGTVYEAFEMWFAWSRLPWTALAPAETWSLNDRGKVWKSTFELKSIGIQKTSGSHHLNTWKSSFLIHIYIYDWWFGAFGLFFHILGMSSSQLTNSYFSEG